MNKPKMIIFDYGNTLLCEPDWNMERGNLELMKYITKNPNNYTIDDIQNEIITVFTQIEKVCNTFNLDIPATTGERLAFEHLGIEFSITPLERQIVYWTTATLGAIMPNADKLLDYLNSNNIRTGVISNMAWSGKALKNRFDRLLPNNKFEFIITSSDYMVRKPDKRLFEIALNKANLDAKDVWYCGDNIKADVFGAHNAGIFPVLYESELSSHNEETIIDFDYLHIHDWCELIEILNTHHDI
jgi:putative hydrolase of the HAD superfamily